MQGRTIRILVVESLSLSRLLAALLFASLAFQDVPLSIVAGIYIFAMCTDLVDGYVARKLTAETYLGKVVDLVSDKSMTIVSLLYAAARGVDLFPLAVIATREVIMIGARIIVVEGTQLLPTSKIVGGVMALFLWSNTLLLVLTNRTSLVRIATGIYWAIAIVFTVNLIVRIYKSSQRIRVSLRQNDQ